MTIAKHGIVEYTDNETAIVKVTMHETCSGCGCCSGTEMRMRVPNTTNARIGDTLEIRSNKADDLSTIFIEFVLPILSIIAGALLGYLISLIVKVPAAACMTAIALALFLVTCIFAVRFDRHKEQALSHAVKAGSSW
jgi:ABC-type transport system involved in cytochrome bd biosynthesis fused ATPase/permease subunit